jgi:hypothetical protein
MSQKRSLMGRIYRAYRSFFEPLHRQVLPLSSNTLVKPTQTVRITGRGQSDGFWPDQLNISNAGTDRGAADWVVNDIKIAGKSQFIQSGDIPGDMFATKAVNTFILFEVAKGGRDVELVVTYIGTNEKGCPFFGAITGMEYDPGLLDILREALSQALGSAARGFSTRPQ